MRQISATKPTTGHDPGSFLFLLHGTQLRSSIELSIDCDILTVVFPLSKLRQPEVCVQN